MRSVAPTRGRDVMDSSPQSQLTIAMSSLGLGAINENEEEKEEEHATVERWMYKKCHKRFRTKSLKLLMGNSSCATCR